MAVVAREEVEGAPWALVGRGWAGTPQKGRTSGGCRGKQGRVSTSWHQGKRANFPTCLGT